VYKRILLCLDGAPRDRVLVEHVAELALLLGSQVLLIRVGTAHPWDAIVGEAERIEGYLAQIRDELTQRGLVVETVAAHGDPAKVILQQVEARGCDLIAMSSHGYRWLLDLLLGSVSSAVKHGARVPLLLLGGGMGER